MSYVLTRLLALNAQPQGWFSGLVNRYQIGVTGQSDGGDTVAALAANACCTDQRVRAVAVLSGAEWPPMPGRYFPRQAPPMLFVQGTADTINPPWTSLQLYQAIRPASGTTLTCSARTTSPVRGPIRGAVGGPGDGGVP